MPKEYINYPVPVRIESPDTGDGKAGVEVLPPGSQVGIHWDGNHETVQLSLDIDWDLLQRIVESHKAPGGQYGDRVIFYTESLSRDDLQRLVKHTRRARDAVFGSDE